MDPNGSTGSSPLTDSELSGKNDRQTGDEDDAKKQQQSRNSAQVGPNQPRKPQPANQATWRPVGTAGLNQVAGVNSLNPGGPIPGAAGQPRYSRPRGPGPSSMQGGLGNVGLQGHGGGAGGQQQRMGDGSGGGGMPPGGAAAWPATRFYPQASRYPQPGNNQSLPGQLSHYQQQQAHMGMQGGAMGAYQARMMQGMGGAGQGHPGASQDQLSKTNLYIRGLPPTTTDRDLYNMCCVYGNINSTKAIIDKLSNQCKGYGFVDFENQQSADRALKELSTRGMQVQMAKIRSQQEQNQMYSQDADPTNLYLANLSPYMVEQDLEAMLQPYGRVVSTRVLRDPSLKSRGVGFARMETREVCEKVIEVLNGKIVAGSQEPLVVKFADSGNRRRMQNRDRNWGRMDHMGYDQMGGGQNGLAGSMMTSIRYSVPQGAGLGGYQPGWQPQYTILPQQMTQMMQGVEGTPYSVGQLAAQMSQLGMNSPYNQAAYSQYGYPQQMYQAGLAQMAGSQGGGQGEDQQSNALEGSTGGQHGNVNSGQSMGAVYSTAYQQQK